MTRGILESPTKDKAWSIQFYGCSNLQWLWVARNPSLAYKLSLREVNGITCPRRCHEVAVLRSQIICRMGFKKYIRGKTKPRAKKKVSVTRSSRIFAVWCFCNDAGLQPSNSAQILPRVSETELRVTSSEVTFTDQRFSWSPLTRLGQRTAKMNLIWGRVKEI